MNFTTTNFMHKRHRGIDQAAVQKSKTQESPTNAVSSSKAAENPTTMVFAAMAKKNTSQVTVEMHAKTRNEERKVEDHDEELIVHSSHNMILSQNQPGQELSKNESKKRLTLESLNIPIPGFKPRPKEKH